MNRYLKAVRLAAGGVLALSLHTAWAYDYPTIDRVEYVQACMQENAGPAQEMIYKCSCVIDAIARKLPYDDYVEESTAAKAYSIAGERGEVMRDAAVIKQAGKRFKALEAEARQSCFIK